MFTATLSNEDCKIKIVFEPETGATLGSVDGLKIKRRELGDTLWTLVKEFDISTIDDFDFSYYDKYTRSRRTYEYQFIPMTGDTEGTAVEDDIECNFDAIYIYDSTAEYILDLEIDYKINRNKPVTFIKPINATHPIPVYNSSLNYMSGTVTCLPLPLDMLGYPTVTGAQKYKEEFFDFLMNEESKLLKTYDGYIWTVAIGESPEEEVSKFEGASKITFDWTQTDYTPVADE